MKDCFKWGQHDLHWPYVKVASPSVLFTKMNKKKKKKKRNEKKQ